MKFLALVLVALVAVTFVMAEDLQDKNCRSIAAKLAIPAETLSKVERFRLYGPSRETCQERCKSIKMDLGFDYYGKQACCCGQPREMS